MGTHLRLHWNPRNTFLKVFAIQAVVITTTILVFSLKNANLSAIYLITLVFAAIILTIFYLAKSGWRLVPFGLLGVFAIGIYNFISKVLLKKKMEKTLGRKIKGEHELVSLTSWMETSNETKSAVQSSQPINNQKRQSPIVSNSQEIKNSPNKLKLGKPLEPRIYHYLFAHRYLPDKLSENSQGVIAWLTGEKGVEHLKTRWTLLPTVYNLEPNDFIEHIGINRYIIKPTNRHTIVLIQFPKPEQISEAFFSAILVEPDNSYRYFTLEKTFEENGNGIPRTVLGEWNNGNHVDLGSGSLPDIEDFSALIVERFI